MGSRGFQDGAGSQYSLPGTWCIFCLFFSYHIKLYIQQSVVETTTRSCSLSLVLNSVSQCVWFLCLLFPQAFWSSCLNTVLVSNRNIFVLYISSLQGTKFIGFIGMRCRGKNKPTPSLSPHPISSYWRWVSSIHGKRERLSVHIIAFNIWLAVWLDRLWGCQSAECVCWTWFYIHSVPGLKHWLSALLAWKEAPWI